MKRISNYILIKAPKGWEDTEKLKQVIKLFRGKAYICKADEMTNIQIEDAELAKLIEDYCNKKKAELEAELEEL